MLEKSFIFLHMNVMVVITQNVTGTEEITGTSKPSIHYQVPH